MAETNLGLLQAMVDGLVGSRDINRLIQERKKLIDLRRDQYEDITARNGLYAMIGQFNQAINDLNFETLDHVLDAIRIELTKLNHLVTDPPLHINASRLGHQVQHGALHTQKAVEQIEQDRYLSPFLPSRKAILNALKTDIQTFRQVALITAAIEERQQQERQRDYERQQQLATQARRQEEQRRREVIVKAEELKTWLCRFESAIDHSVLDQARHALSIIEQSEPEVLSAAFAGQEPSMVLSRLRRQVESLRRDLYGNHGIRNMDAPIPTAAIS
jgi:hypothetical protein